MKTKGIVKYIFSFLVLGLFGLEFSFGIDLDNEEILNLSDKVYQGKLYESNIGNTYSFLGGYEHYVFETQKKYEDLKDYLNEYLIIEQQNEIFSMIDLTENKFDYKQNCTYIDSENNFLNHLYDVKKYDLEHTFIGNKTSLSCYYGDKTVYFPKHPDFDGELDYFIKNSDKINQTLDEIDLQKPFKKYNGERLKLYNLYSFVIENSEYEQSVVGKTQEQLQQRQDYTPWFVSSFFENKKIVCDGYVKTIKFLASLYDIDLKRIVGGSHPIDKTNDVGHSWLKYGDVYLDPTYEDTGDLSGKDKYFLKSKECLTLTHYQKDGIKFDSSEQRYTYLLDNFDILDDCDGLIRKVLYRDIKVKEFVEYLLEEKSLNVIKDKFCNILNICNVNETDRDEYLDYLGNRIIIYYVDGEKIQIDLQKIVENLDKINKPNKVSKDNNELETDEKTVSKDDNENDKDEQSKTGKTKESFDGLSEKEKEKYDERISEAIEQIKEFYPDSYLHIYRQLIYVLTDMLQDTDNVKQKEIIKYIHESFVEVVREI